MGINHRLCVFPVVPFRLILSENPLAAPGSTEEGIGEQVYIEKAR